MDEGDKAMRFLLVLAGFDMEGDRIGAGFGEGKDMLLHRFHHQMDVVDHMMDAMDSFHEVGPEGFVWHEKAIHHIQMEVGGAGFLHLEDFLFDMGEIGG